MAAWAALVIWVTWGKLEAKSQLLNLQNENVYASTSLFIRVIKWNHMFSVEHKTY
jgi:hypothetical protein